MEEKEKYYDENNFNFLDQSPRLERLRLKREKKKEYDIANKNDNYILKKTKKRKNNSKLLIMHPLLFIISKKERIKEYEENIKTFGYSLEKVPTRYRTLKLCKLSIEKAPEMFEPSLIPKKYFNEEFIKYCIRCNVNLSKIPNQYINEDLVKYALKEGTRLFMIPNKYIDKKTCEFAVKANPYNILDIKYKNFLNSHIYAIACENGLPINDVPSNYINEEVCIGYVNKTKSIRNIPKEYRTDELYEILVKLDADNLKDVPFVPKNNLCKRTINMCVEYVKQKHTVNFDLFPERYFSLALRESLFNDAVKYRDILDGYMNYNEYIHVKSLRYEQQVLIYVDLLKRYLQNRLMNESYTIPSATNEEIESLKSIESLNLLKDMDTEKIFCKTQQEIIENSKKLSELTGKLVLTIQDEDHKFSYVKNSFSIEKIKKIASEFYYRFKKIFENDTITDDNKKLLTEALSLELKEVTKNLDVDKKEIFIREIKSLNNKLSKDLTKNNFDNEFKDVDVNYSAINKNADDLNGVISKEIDLVINGIDNATKK